MQIKILTILQDAKIIDREYWLTAYADVRLFIMDLVIDALDDYEREDREDGTCDTWTSGQSQRTTLRIFFCKQTWNFHLANLRHRHIHKSLVRVLAKPRAHRADHKEIPTTGVLHRYQQLHSPPWLQRRRQTPCHPHEARLQPRHNDARRRVVLGDRLTDITHDKAWGLLSANVSVSGWTIWGRLMLKVEETRDNFRPRIHDIVSILRRVTA